MEYEEIEIEVRQVGTEASTEAPPVVELIRHLALAGIGAVATTRDEAEQFFGRLVAKGEETQKQGQQFLRSFAGREQPLPATTGGRGRQLSERPLDRLLSRLNIPSRRDVDDLHARLARLSARVEELSQAAKPEQPRGD